MLDPTMHTPYELRRAADGLVLATQDCDYSEIVGAAVALMRAEQCSIDAWLGNARVFTARPTYLEDQQA